jgi:hypothetical protein
MDSRPIFVLLSLLAATAVMAEAYRWVDDDGVMHYSDRPQEGAERFDLSTYSGPSSAPRRTTTRPVQSSALEDLQQRKTQFRYEVLRISAPGAEETLWDIGGALNVSLAVTPPLQAGHRVRVYFDGEPRLVSGTTFQLQEVWRGVHNLQAEILDATGKLMIRSQPNRFYVQQNTVIQQRR